MTTRRLLVRALIAVSLLGATQARAQESPRLPAYRARILGVFDANTGEPIEGAQVSDVLSKASSLTTKTGKDKPRRRNSRNNSSPEVPGM